MESWVVKGVESGDGSTYNFIIKEWADSLQLILFYFWVKMDGDIKTVSECLKAALQQN